MSHFLWPDWGDQKKFITQAVEEGKLTYVGIIQAVCKALMAYHKSKPEREVNGQTVQS